MAREPGCDDDLDDLDDIEVPPDDGLVSLGSILDGVENDWTEARELAAMRSRERIRSPAYVIDAERSLVGAALLSPDTVLAATEETGLRSEDFYHDKLRELWRVILILHDAKEPISVLTVVDELQRRNILGELGGPQVVSQLEAHAIVGAIPFARANAKMIISKARLRSIARAASTALERCHLGDNAATVAEDLLGALNAVSVSRVGGTGTDLSAVTRTVLDSLPAFGGKPSGMSIGFRDVDYYFRPGPGDLIIIAARPSMGKTAFALDGARSLAIDRGHPIMFFSLEMTAEQLVHRLLAGHSGVEIKKKNMNAQESSTVVGAAGDIAAAPIIIDETPAISIGEIKARARQQQRRRALAGVFVDYIQLVTPSRSSDNRSTEVGEITSGLKALARELRCPVFALSQLNRSVELRADRRPVMSDLRESGSIEQDADVVTFLYRDEYYSKDRCPAEKRGIAELVISKNRNGPTGVVHLRFNQNLPRFDSLARP